jgi:hypothetical protein
MSIVKTAAGLVEYCKQSLGLPYWYGAFGQTGTAELYYEYKTMYPKYYKFPKESYTKQFGQRVQDCVGLIKGYLWSNDIHSEPKYNKAQDLSANGMFKACTMTGNIINMPEVPGLLVWKDGHIGVYIGDGQIIEAKGHESGVIQTRVEDRDFECWGQCKFILYEAPERAYNLTHTYLRKGSHGKQVVALQAILESLGYDLKPYGVDGDFGIKTHNAVIKYQQQHNLSPDGIVGPLTGAKIFGVE